MKLFILKNNFIATNLTIHSKLLNKEKYNKKLNLKMYLSLLESLKSIFLKIIT